MGFSEEGDKVEYRGGAQRWQRSPSSESIDQFLSVGSYSGWERAPTLRESPSQATHGVLEGAFHLLE